MKRISPLLIGVAMILNVSIVRAEKWENTGHGSQIDVDSIRKAADGVVYYNQRRNGSDSKYAFDCKNGISYSSITGPNWKSSGIAVKSGTMGGELKNFVCSRVR